MPVLQVVDVISMLHGRVPASGTMIMGGMLRMGRHIRPSLLKKMTNDQIPTGLGYSTKP